jgi:DNA-binding NarL/FixJ family response regulator
MATSVLIVDDHSSFRAAARLLLELEGYEVVGEAETGTEAVERAERLQPDFVLLDVNLPDINGFQVAERLTANETGPAVVLTSSHEGADFGTLIEGSGARGFIPKGELSGARLAALLP